MARLLGWVWTAFFGLGNFTKLFIFCAQKNFDCHVIKENYLLGGAVIILRGRVSPKKKACIFTCRFFFFFQVYIKEMSDKEQKVEQPEAMEIVEDETTKQQRLTKETITGKAK